MVVHLDLALEVAVDHLADGGRAIWRHTLNKVVCSDISFRLLQKVNIPGKRITLTRLPISTKRCSRSLTWVVFPLRSNPSTTIRAPRATSGSGPAFCVVVVVVEGPDWDCGVVVFADGASAADTAEAAVARSFIDAMFRI